MSAEKNQHESTSPRRSDAASGVSSDREMADLAPPVTDLVNSGLPLAPGLRALAEEVASRPLRRALIAISERLDAGESLTNVLHDRDRATPGYLVGLIDAGVRSGNLGLVIQQFLDATRESTSMRIRLWSGLCYSVILLSVLLIVGLLFLCIVVPGFGSIYLDFGVALPKLTECVIGSSRFLLTTWPWMLCVAAALVLAVFMLRSQPRWHSRLAWVAARVPIIGPTLELPALAHYCRLLAILLDAEVPLPEALRLAGSGIRNWNIRAGSRLMADDVERGLSLRESLQQNGHFPKDMASVFRWQQHDKAFAEALTMAGELYATRAAAQIGLVSVAIEPFVIFAVALFVAIMVLSLFLPFVKLIQCLS